MRKRTGIYHSLVILPDKLFPFKTEVEGQWVRGIRSYNARLAHYQRRYGAGTYGFKLNAYRQLFHFLGSIAFLLIAAFFSQRYLGGIEGMLALLGAAVGLVSFQEFYLHRRMYQQLWRKGLTDWLAWCTPFIVYFFTHFY